MTYTVSSGTLNSTIPYHTCYICPVIDQLLRLISSLISFTLLNNVGGGLELIPIHHGSQPAGDRSHKPIGVIRLP